MTLTSSMYAGISGLQAYSEKTSVISNNIANTGTVGFKSGSVEFADVFYSTVSSGSGNAQVGTGVNISSIDTDFTQGSYESGTSTTDLAIGGDGFFMVSNQDSDTTYYTRAGNFSFDEDGYLVDANGLTVQGWEMEDGSISGAIGDIQLENFQSPPLETNSIDMSLNLDSTSTDNAISTTDPFFAEFGSWDGSDADDDGQYISDSKYAYATSLNVYDENGTSHEITTYMDPVDVDSDGNQIWEFIVTGDPSDDLRVIGDLDLSTTEAAGLYMTGTLTFNSSGELKDMSAFTLSDAVTSASDPTALTNWVPATFNTEGEASFYSDFTGVANNDITSGQQIAIDFGITNKDITAGTDGWTTTITNASEILTDYTNLPSITDKSLDASATTCYSLSSATNSQSQDGYSAGYLQDVAVDSYGVLSGSYSNGQDIELYAVALADFNNSSGLYQEGGNLFSATLESGTALTGQAGSTGFGDISSSTLESSNVDMSQELTELIISQSSFKANSKIITTIDDMLTTVIGMKR